jgi:hypothetical protein
MTAHRPWDALRFSLERLGAPGTGLSPRGYKWEKK